MEVGPAVAMAQGPVADAVGAKIQHRGERQLRAAFIRPPRGEIQLGIQTKLVMPATHGHGGWVVEGLLALARAVSLKPVNGPVAVGGQVDLPVARLIIVIVIEEEEEVYFFWSLPFDFMTQISL